MVNIFINLLLGVWALVALLMMLVILMQRPKSEGLGAAFGGGVTENIFGAQTTNVLVKFTTWLAGIFFLLTFTLSILYAHKSMSESSLTRELKKTAPATQTSPPAQSSPVATASPASALASPASSDAPDSGVGVVPAGTAAPSADASVAPNPRGSAPAVKPSPKKPKP